MSDAEVLIVGAGPAGAALAAHLGGRGRRVLLIDRARFPRDKTCGECLGPGAIGLLERLELRAALQAAGAWPYHGVRLVAPSGARAEARYPARAEGLTLSRLALDAVLLDRARATPGVTVREGLAVEDVLQGVPGVRLRGGETLTARVLVGADGRYSKVRARAFAEGPFPAARRFCFLNTFEGGPGEDDVLELGLVHAGLQYLRVYQGQGRYSVCLVTDEPTRAAHEPGKLETFQALALAQPRLAERLAGARPVGPMKGMPLAPYAPPALVADGMLLVGDAVGFMDPITGEGMYRALTGAAIAAGVIDAALASPGPVTAAALMPYQAAMAAQFAPVLGFVALAVKLTTLPGWAAEPLVRALALSPWACRALAMAQGALAPPHAALWPGTWSRLAKGVHP